MESREESLPGRKKQAPSPPSSASSAAAAVAAATRRRRRSRINFFSLLSIESVTNLFQSVICMLTTFFTLCDFWGRLLAPPSFVFSPFFLSPASTYPGLFLFPPHILLLKRVESAAWNSLEPQHHTDRIQNKAILHISIIAHILLFLLFSICSMLTDILVSGSAISIAAF